jgi:hypothetical protein
MAYLQHIESTQGFMIGSIVFEALVARSSTRRTWLLDLNAALTNAGPCRRFPYNSFCGLLFS